MYDLIIIGSGPAGMTAAIFACRREMKTLIIGKEPGGQMIWASEIENYPGFKSIKSFELINLMLEQAKSSGAEIKMEEVREIKPVSQQGKLAYFTVFTAKEQFTAKSLIIAMGLAPRRLAIPGEKEFTGRGVSYCANCDGPFYRDKIVAVAGGGNAALDAAEVLSKIGRKVYLIHRRDSFKAFENLVEEVKARNNIEIILNSEIKEVLGKEKMEKIKVADSQTGEEREIAVDGLFIEVGRTAQIDWLEKLIKLNEQGQIIVDEKCRTNQEGIFAAGDVTEGEFKQITIACGQGTIAALAAYQYLQDKKAGEK